MGLTSKLDKLKISHEHSERANVSDSADSDDIDEMDNEGQSILMGIIAQLRPGMDLSRITLPTFILEKKSMLERITNFFQIPELLLKANDTSDDVERFVLILAWYLASWHIAPKAVKKPLNPVLGETFDCYWNNVHGDHAAYYISEQVSHHPPKSAYFYLVPDAKIKVDGILIPKSRFLGNSSAAMMEGWAHLTLGEHGNEIYEMNQPNVYCRGILFGKMKMELGDHMYVKCKKTGIEADIDFKTKGFISGTYDAIDGYIKNSKTSENLYHITGKWNEVMEIKDLNTGKKRVLVDTKKTVPVKPKVRPLDEQGEFESRKLWKPTVDALANRDHTVATEEKFKIEDEQRNLAKKRLEDGVEFHPKFFRPVTDKERDLQDLEYVIYKRFDLKDDPEVLTNEVLSIAPILPGQKYEEKFEIPAFKKHEQS
ncbi:Oxysterol-binding protein-like protein OBPa [Candida viswanathii]|uniref:Oxysterol-binding protein-like protein OBPa n=1 Tax=Candida viswanathii TaxID=5486 RepID=A0A367YHP2_9ASCO|nr:Oxysterol-binding protein-like protein OBPa [Candida viswanathii]